MEQKFVVTAFGELRMGTVRMHRDLLDGWEDCIGGGFWAVDNISRRLLLDGASYDFGPPVWGRLLREGITLKVPSEFIGWKIIYTRDDGSLVHVSEILDIEPA